MALIAFLSFVVVVESSSGAEASTPDLRAGQSLTAGQSVAYGPYDLMLQGDGDIVASEDGTAVWSNGMSSPGAVLELTQTGLIEVSSSGSVIWEVDPRHSGRCLVGGTTTGTMVASTSNGLLTWPLWTLTPCWSGSAGSPRVAVVGDSITWDSTAALEKRLASRFQYQISGQRGWRIDQQEPATEAMLSDPEGPPQDFIFNLGTNDVIQYNDSAAAQDWQHHYEQLLSLSGTACTILVTVYAQAADFYGQNHEAWAINDFIDRQARHHANTHVVDWNKLLKRGGASKWLQSDNLHPNAAGSAELASLYRQALLQDCPVG